MALPQRVTSQTLPQYFAIFCTLNAANVNFLRGCLRQCFDAELMSLAGYLQRLGEEIRLLRLILELLVVQGISEAECLTKVIPE